MNGIMYGAMNAVSHPPQGRGPDHCLLRVRKLPVTSVLDNCGLV